MQPFEQGPYRRGSRVEDRDDAARTAGERLAVRGAVIARRSRWLCEARIEDAKGRLVSRSTGTSSCSAPEVGWSAHAGLGWSLAIRSRDRRLVGVSIRSDHSRPVSTWLALQGTLPPCTRLARMGNARSRAPNPRKFQAFGSRRESVMIISYPPPASPRDDEVPAPSSCRGMISLHHDDG